MTPICTQAFFKGDHFLRVCGRLIVFSSLIFAPAYLFGQGFTPDPDWRFENFNGQSHFIDNEINNVVVDKNGYVWTASTGVQRFDGYKTAHF